MFQYCCTMNLSPYIDHTVLKATTSLQDITRLCSEAALHNFAAVCVPPPYIKRAKVLLEPFPVKVATVVGFPFGYSATEAKLSETILALVDGADEIDMVINLIALRLGEWEYLAKEVSFVTEMVHKKNKTVKVIIESGVLSDEEIIQCCETFAPLNIDYMKTSTGYAEHGASVHAVLLMRQFLPPNIKIKASGGIRSYAFAKELVEAGAERLGCSASVAIIQEAPDYAVNNN